MESFLKEQLKRIQELTERMSTLERHAAELSRALERDREHIRQGPLSAVRDFRTYRSNTPAPADTAHDRPARRRSKRRRR
jgi:flagellar motility protein MotE (MotC chaperone)